MTSVIPACVAAALFILLLPLHIDNYIYFNAEERYAGVNVTLYRLIRVFNANTVRNSPGKMQINGEDKKIDTSFLKSNGLKIFNNLTLTKVVQLGDYGIAGDGGAYAAVVQNAITQTVYSFIEANGGKTKLKNYIVLNREHSNVVCYAKISGVINLLAVIKLILILITEKLNES